MNAAGGAGSRPASLPSSRLAAGLLLGGLGLSIAWAPWPVLAAMGAALLLAAIVVWPALGLALAAVGVPFGAWAPLALPGGAGALTVTPLLLAWTAMAVAARAALLAPQAPARPGLSAHDLWLEARPIAYALTLYLVVLAASGWRAASLGAVLVESARWVELGLAIALAAWIGRRPGGRAVILAGLLAAAGAEALFGAIRALGAIGPEAFLILGGRLTRAHGSFGQPNPFGGYMNMAWPLGAALAAAWWLPGRGAVRLDRDPERGGNGDDQYGDRTHHAHAGWPRAWGVAGLVVAGLCGAGLVLSWSRGAWLAALGAAAAIGLVRLGRAQRDREPRALTLAYAGLCLGVAMAAFGLLPNPPASITARLATIARGPALAADVAQAEVTDASFATVERLAHWAAAGSMWSQRPWLGQGPGHYEIAYAAHRLPRWPAPLGHAHNDYLQALAETGLLGLLAWLALLAALLWTCARAALGRGPRRGGLWHATLGLGALGVWAATVTHGLFDRLYVHDMTVHLGLLTGLVLATAAGGALLEREA